MSMASGRERKQIQGMQALNQVEQMKMIRPMAHGSRHMKGVHSLVGMNNIQPALPTR